MKFTKMHGIGNDYIYINCFEETVEDPGGLAKRLSDRHTGIGSDGLVLIRPSETADFRMDMFNSDGSQAQMCGNAIRCVGKYVYDHGLTKETTITVDTLAGVKTLWLTVENGKVTAARVNMGKPEFAPGKIPVAAEGEKVVDYPVMLSGKEYRITCVSMGNPHAVLFVDDVDSLNLETLGPRFEHHPLFPERINTEFVKVLGRGRLRMRVWERGAGETMACGTGACASLAAAYVNGLSDHKAELLLNGGSLFIEWDEESGCIFMTGPAETVFTGEVEL